MKQLYSILRAQTLGVLSQVLSALPLLFISMQVARTVGLRALAELTLLVGLSAVLFTLSLLGLRTALLKDRFSTINLGTYVAIRLGSGIFLLIASIALSVILNISLMLASVVALLRVGDLALDLTLAIDQVRQTEKEHLYGFLSGQAVKLMVVIFAGLCVWQMETFTAPYFPLLVAASIHCGMAFHLIRKQCAGTPGVSVIRLARVEFGLVQALVGQALPFLAAQLLCALLTAFPRITLDVSTKSPSITLSTARSHR